MGKGPTMYKLTFAPVSDTIRVIDNGAEKDWPMREAERRLLISLALSAANTTKENSKIYCAMDLAERIEALTNDDNMVLLDKTDKEILENGIKACADGRPFLGCKKMWKQITCDNWDKTEGTIAE